MKILQFLGYSKVVLRCDAWPVLMKVQSLLQTARQKLGWRMAGFMILEAMRGLKKR